MPPKPIDHQKAIADKRRAIEALRSDIAKHEKSDSNKSLVARWRRDLNELEQALEVLLSEAPGIDQIGQASRTAHSSQTDRISGASGASTPPRPRSVAALESDFVRQRKQSDSRSLRHKPSFLGRLAQNIGLSKPLETDDADDFGEIDAQTTSQLEIARGDVDATSIGLSARAESEAQRKVAVAQSEAQVVRDESSREIEVMRARMMSELEEAQKKLEKEMGLRATAEAEAQRALEVSRGS